ncbi:hypothetical protein ACEN88_03770 [Massilia sp. CT11-108]|uniref:hypothetical protein n=1 Tax=Massilia sp. CT11-108 TaxID=3393900 RepID=UPI0039A6EEE0
MNLSKIEKLALEKIKGEVEKPISFVYSGTIDPDLLSALQIFWCTNSQKIVVENSISLVASSYLRTGIDILKMAKPDRLIFLKEITLNPVPKSTSAKDKSFLSIRVCTWQLFLILSKSDINIKTSQQLVDFCLRKAFEARAMLFGDTTEMDIWEN